MTAYAKKLTAAGYRKVKVSELEAGMVVLYHTADGAVDKVVASVAPGRRGVKEVQFTDGSIGTAGNAGKFWAKG